MKRFKRAVADLGYWVAAILADFGETLQGASDRLWDSTIERPSYVLFADWDIPQVARREAD